MTGTQDGFTLNLSLDDVERYVLKDIELFKKNPNYLEDSFPMAKQIFDELEVLRLAKKTDTPKAIELYGMYDGIKQLYLTQFFYGF